MPNCASYLALLNSGPPGQDELDALIADLTIGETFFFRHREMFDALRTIVLPELIDRNRQRRQLRIWSAGCSTGEEPYTLNMVMLEEAHGRLKDWNIEIMATDLNERSLEHAKNAIYGTYLAPEGAGAPARSTVEVSRLPKDVLVEIELIAEG